MLSGTYTHRLPACVHSTRTHGHTPPTTLMYHRTDNNNGWVYIDAPYQPLFHNNSWTTYKGWMQKSQLSPAAAPPSYSLVCVVCRCVSIQLQVTVPHTHPYAPHVLSLMSSRNPPYCICMHTSSTPSLAHYHAIPRHTPNSVTL